MNKKNIELNVGLFIIVGLLSFAYLAVKMGDIALLNNDSYQLQSRFTSISGLKEGANIELAGVNIGKVSDIILDNEEYEAVVTLSISKQVKLQEDSIAAIRTAGIIGDRYIVIKPGGSDIYLSNNDEITETESAISLEELISKYIFESK
ncbi:MAG: outer membrane lipid asymmetry maintenance protein MlaD [Gammaproteobacteria bacterium]|nr:outer membrane lipid asymmetry maintenance protein MlaD [Gammaproteobacteria bacterium]